MFAMYGQSYEAVIFDMDGVILDSEPLHQQLEARMYQELGISVSAEEVRSYIGVNSYEMWRTFRERHGVTRSVEELVQIERDRYRRIVAEQGVPFVPGVLELIRNLAGRGIRLAVASSAPREQIDHALESAEMTALFQARVSGDEVLRSKPDPAIFLLAAERLRVDTGACIVIEDAPHGVAAARAAGMRCIGFADPESGSLDLSKADMVCSSMEEVWYVLEGSVLKGAC